MASTRLMTRILAFLLVGALAGLQGDPNYAKLIEDAKFSLAEAIAKAAKEVPGCTPVSGYMEENEGPAEAEVDVFAAGKVTKVYVNAVTGDVIRTEAKR